MSNNNNEEPKVRTPEYIRLGVKPIGSSGKSLLHNTGGIPKVQPAKRRIPPPPQPVIAHRKISVEAGMPNTPIQMGIRSRGNNAPSAAKEVPAQTRVNIGVHDEQKWTEGLKSSSEQFPNRRVVINPDGSKRVVIDNDEYVDVEGLQGMNPLEDDDTDRPPPEEPRNEQQEEYEEYVSEPDQSSEEPQTESAVLEPGEYAVFYAGECVYRTEDLDKLKSGLENMMVKYKVNLDDVRIYRCIPIRFGIILE